MFKKAINNTSFLAPYILSIVLFPLLCENIITTIFGSQLSNIFSAISCIILLFFILIQKKMRFSPFLIVTSLLVVFHIILYIVASSTPDVTISNASPTVNSLISPYGILAYFILFLFIEQCLSSINKTRVIFLASTIALSVGIIANIFLTGNLQIADNISTFQQAVNTGYTNSRVWLFGHRNQIFIHHLLWILFTYLCAFVYQKNYTKIFIAQILLTLLVGIISWNSTMIIATMIISILFALRHSLLKKLNILVYIIVYLILELGIVFLRLQNSFSSLIVTILHRNLSFTGRTAIWNYYLNQYGTSGPINKLFGNFGKSTIVANSHNMGLGLLAFTGISGVALYASTIVLTVKTLLKERHADIARIISIIIFGFLINSLTMEFYLQPLIALYFGYHATTLNNMIGKRNEK